ncbi:retrovirus-related pol polyprotein from transposon TNT 1-94 [Tanacetum coccineum]
MSTANQQTLAELGASDRPPILEKGSYVPWASQFLGIPNDINNSMDACLDAQTMWARIRRLMHGSDISEQERHSRLINEFDKFVVVEGESLTSMYDRNQAVIQDGRVDIQSKNVGYAGNGNRNAGRQNINQAANIGIGMTNVQCYNCNEKGHYARDCPKPRVRDAKYFREKMLLATKDEAEVHLDEEENDFMFDNAYRDDTLEELSATVIMMSRIQPADGKSDVEPKYDAEVISVVNASQINLINGMLSKGVHEKKNHEKIKTVIHTSTDDQIDSDIIFDNPYVEDNSGQDAHDSNAHDQSYADIESLIYNVQVEAENQQKMNNELKSKKRCYKRNLRLVRNGLKSNKLKVDLTDYEETLEDAKKSQLKMKDKMIQLDYSKLNAIYESFGPQTEILVEQTYFSYPSTSNVSLESSLEKSDIPPKKMPSESKLLKLFVNLDKEIKELGHLNIDLKMDKDRAFPYENKVGIRWLFTQ